MGARRARSAMLTIVRLMKTPTDVTGPINIGNPSEFTMLGLAEMIMELTNSRSRIVYRPLPSGRSEATQARHLKSERGASLVSACRPERGPDQDDRILRADGPRAVGAKYNWR
jgi:hypothetical protein